MTAVPTADPPHARRVGILGGTFDPIHIGHLVAAVNVRAALDLDVVLFVVANLPWQKVGERSVTAAADRYTLVEAAIGDTAGLEACDIEIARGGLSYTADTIDELRRSCPGDELFLIVGSDVAASLGTWHHPEQIRAEVTLAVMNRAGSTPAEADTASLVGWKAVMVEIPAIEVSSTDLRERVARGRPIDYLVPERAIRIIEDRRLYALGR